MYENTAESGGRMKITQLLQEMRDDKYISILTRKIRMRLKLALRLSVQDKSELNDEIIEHF